MQPGDRLVKAAVGDHRRDDRAHADIGIGRRDEAQPFERSAAAIRRRGRSRRCSPSAPSRPRRAGPTDISSSALRLPVIQGAADSSSSSVQRSPIPLARLPWPWVWALTRPGWISAARRADLDRALRGGAAGRADFADRVVLDQDVGGVGGAGGDVEHPAAAQDRVGHRAFLPSLYPPYRRGILRYPRIGRQQGNAFDDALRDRAFGRMGPCEAAARLATATACSPVTANS